MESTELCVSVTQRYVAERISSEQNLGCLAHIITLMDNEELYIK